jgi:hypothetical protein
MINTKWKGLMTKDGKGRGKGETIFEEPESVDMGWLNKYREMTPPASVWVSTSEEEIDHDARLSQGARRSSSTSRSRRSEEQRAEDVRRSKDSGVSDERYSQRSQKSEEQRTVDMRRSRDSGMSDYSQRSRVNMRRPQDARMSDESLRPAQKRITAEKWIEELRVADEKLARVRNGRGYKDCNLL